MTVVDLFEVVDIEKQDCQWIFSLAGLGKERFENFIESRFVG